MLSSQLIGQVAKSAKAVAEQCDITVAMLADPEAAEAVATGPEGIAAGMKKGRHTSWPAVPPKHYDLQKHVVVQPLVDTDCNSIKSNCTARCRQRLC